MEAQTVQLAVFSVILVLCSCQISRDRIMEDTEKLRRLPLEDCGEPSKKLIDRKIVGGEPAELGAYPWMAAIGYTRAGSDFIAWRCGGSLITDRYVLTAAHCLHPLLIKDLNVSWVRLGDLNLMDTFDDGATPQDIEVETYIIHKDYTNVQRINDIGLVKAKRKVEFNDLLKPICLPHPGIQTNSLVGETAVVTGWGLTNFTDKRSASAELREAALDIQDLDECRRNITSVITKSVLDNRVLCASAPDKDSCQGDSGGPLMRYERFRGRTKMYLLGIVSYGRKCAESGFPGVYTRVYEFLPWIVQNLEI